VCIDTSVCHSNSILIRFYVNQYVSIRSHILGNSAFSYILTFKVIEYVLIVFHIHGNSVCIDTFLCWNSICIDPF
jgi:type IV secretory pathway VirB6-like protein